MNRIQLEPARYGMTGEPCGITSAMRYDCEPVTVQPLDAPEFVARGSVQSGHQMIDGRIYASTTSVVMARMYGGWE